MRAGALSNSKVIKLLNEHYVNLFLLTRDVRELQDGTKNETVRQMARTVSIAFEEATAQGIDGSVNIFVLSPELELIGHLPYHDIKRNKYGINKDKYLTFLKDSLTKNK